MEALFFILILLACPLMMLFMMRGHGRGQEHGGHTGNGRDVHRASSSDLRRRRDELDREIERRERDELLR